MPLSTPSARHPLHTRTVRCEGFARDDGLWDIEGYLRDIKSYTFANRDRGEIKAGEPIHDMAIRLTIDVNLTIHAAEAVIDAAPFAMCPRISARFALLKGIRIGAGWRKQLKQLFGGVSGCTHLLELLHPMATTAYQTLYRAREEQARANPQREKPAVIDTCHTFASDSEVVHFFWPQFYNGTVDHAK